MKTFDHILPRFVEMVWSHLTSGTALLRYPREKDDAVIGTVKSFVYKEQWDRDISSMENGRPLRCASCKQGPSMRKLDFFILFFICSGNFQCSIKSWAWLLKIRLNTYMSYQAFWWEGNSLPGEGSRCNPAFTRLHQPVGMRDHIKIMLSQ